MPAFTIKDLPDAVYQRLKKQADVHRRSLNGEGMRNVAALLAIMVTAPAWRAAAQTAWRVDAKPVLDVSSNSRTGTVLFARVSGATRLSDGTIVIADADDKVLHFFDATGKPLHSAGHEGSGPGEFRHVTWLGRCSGDSLHVWDMLQQRMAVFAPGGAFVRQCAVPSDSAAGATPLMTLACSSLGVIAFQGQPVMSKMRVAPKNPAMPTREERAIKTAAVVSIANSTGKVTKRVGERPSGTMYLMGGGGFPLPLAGTTYVAVAGDRVFVGSADSTSSVASYAADGTMTTLKLSIPARPSTPAQRALAATAMASMAPQQVRRMAEDSLKVSPMPATLPPYSALFGDSDGVLWVQLTVPGDPSTRLRAVDAGGKMLGEIALPANLVVHEIGRDYVLGAYDDADDVPHLAMFRLHRGR